MGSEDLKPKDPRRRFLMSGDPSSVRKYTAHFLSRGSFGVYSRGKVPVTVLAYHPNSRSPDPLSKGSTGLDTILLDLPSGFIFRFWLKRSAAYPPLPEGSTHLKLVNPTLNDQGVVRTHYGSWSSLSACVDVHFWLYYTIPCLRS